jgi:hypothetical protein
MYSLVNPAIPILSFIAAEPEREKTSANDKSPSTTNAFLNTFTVTPPPISPLGAGISLFAFIDKIKLT